MRPIRKRLTLGNLMIAVVAFALSLKLGLAYNRSPKYWEESRFYARAGVSAHYMANLYESGAAHLDNDTPAERRKAAERSRNFATFTDRMKAKYQRAAFLPWLPDTPDLPSP